MNKFLCLNEELGISLVKNLISTIANKTIYFFVCFSTTVTGHWRTSKVPWSIFKNLIKFLILWLVFYYLEGIVSLCLYFGLVFEHRKFHILINNQYTLWFLILTEDGRTKQFSNIMFEKVVIRGSKNRNVRTRWIEI